MQKKRRFYGVIRIREKILEEEGNDLGKYMDRLKAQEKKENRQVISSTE